MATTIIKPKKMFSWNDIRELWAYKELMYFFTWRDLKVRYKQTIVGAGWAIFQPLMTMFVFTVFFGNLAKMPSDNVPYPIFIYTGLLFWNFFSSALGDTSNCLISNQAIITKVYFPRLILPISSVLTKIVDFSIAFLVLGVLMIYYGFMPNLIGVLIIPLLLLITFMASVGLGLFLASINVKYRDLRYILPFFVQMLMYLTPVIYPASIAGEYSWLLAINPMTGVIQNARAAILNTAVINWNLIFISLIACLALLAFGTYSFKKTERYFADVI
ncbi:MAG: ABC transporter permease [bacterium]